MDRRDFLKAAGASLASLAIGCAWQGTANRRSKDRQNFLFIIVDDLRPQLNCYGQSQMITPNINRIASDGVVFSRAYCQVPVCGASRASLFTGIRPTRKRFTTYYTWAQKDAPNAITLGEHFKNNGYHTLSNGKVFHHNDDSVQSWSEPHYQPGGNWRDYQLQENVKLLFFEKLNKRTVISR